MELIVASTPYDGLRRELLGKPIGHALKDILKEGRKYEALLDGNEQLQLLDTKQRVIHSVSYVRKCGECFKSHTPRKCPAYKDTCSACSSIGHWRLTAENLERNNVQEVAMETQRANSQRQSWTRQTTAQTTPSTHRKNNGVHSIDTECETDGESYQ